MRRKEKLRAGEVRGMLDALQRAPGRGHRNETLENGVGMIADRLTATATVGVGIDRSAPCAGGGMVEHSAPHHANTHEQKCTEAERQRDYVKGLDAEIPALHYATFRTVRSCEAR